MHLKVGKFNVVKIRPEKFDFGKITFIQTQSNIKENIEVFRVPNCKKHSKISIKSKLWVGTLYD